MKIAGVNMKYNRKYGSYYGTTKPEPYSTGKDHFIPSFRSIYVSSEMYPGTSRSFFYVTSNIHGKMRQYRHRDWFSTDIANIFASGKTLKSAVTAFERNFRSKIYNRRG